MSVCGSFDAQFYGNGTGAKQTITMSDRDVIYVTRAMIPFLRKYGVEGLTIGSNGANYPPQVPKLHVWRDEASGQDVIVIYHPCVRAAHFFRFGFFREISPVLRRLSVFATTGFGCCRRLWWLFSSLSWF
jgi:hypothetical protein